MAILDFDQAGGLLGGFVPMGAGGAQAPLGFMDTLAQNRNAIVGLGLGLMGGSRDDPYGPAMRGYSAGAANDQTALYRQAMMKRAAEEQAYREKRDKVSDTFRERQLSLTGMSEADKAARDMGYSPGSLEHTNFMRDWYRRKTEGTTPSGFVRTDTGMVPVPGGPADPGYLREAEAAKAKPTDSFDPEMKLRKEFEIATKPHTEIRQSYGRVLASKNDAAGDIALVYGFMKMLDPGSVVREGEFATAQNSGGIPDTIRNAYNRALSGERLTPGQRESFKSQAGAISEKYQSEYDARANQFRGIAKQYNLDPSRVIPDTGPAPKAPPSAKAIEAEMRRRGLLK